MVEEIEIHNTTRLEPVGECIYCGSTDKLTDEHIVPLALGGRLVLPDASCVVCAAITSAVERKVLRGFMLDARAVGKFPTRRPKERPRTSSLDIERDGHFESIELPSSESPGFLHLPRFARAAFLAGYPPMKGVTFVGIDTLYFGKNPTEVARAIGTKTIRTTVTVDASSFARMLAKIGYSYAVASQGLYPRTEVPVLPMILGS